MGILGLLFLLSGCRGDKSAQFSRLQHLGEDLFAEKHYVAAIDAWEKALKIHPDSPEIYRKIGKTYLRLAYPSRAEEAFKEVIRLRPDAWDALLEVGKLRLIALDMETGEAIWKDLAPQRNKPAINVFHGDLLVLKGLLGEAEKAYRKALEIDPEYQPALIKLATCSLAQGKIVEADHAYNIVLALKPKSPEILLQMGNYWKLKGDLKKAEAYLLQSANADKGDLGLRQMLAEFYFDNRQYEKARKLTEELLAQMPKNLSLKKYLFKVLLAQNNLSAAREVMDDLLNGGHYDLETGLLRGKYHLLAGEPNFAVGEFVSVVKDEPNLSVAHYLLGLAYLMGGKTELAKQSFVKVLTIDRFYFDAELALADIYYKQKDYELCLDYAGRVAKREPENYRSHLIMANALLAQRHYDKALIKFEAAHQINPDAVSPVYYIAVTFEKMNQRKKALESFRNLLTEHPELADAGMHYARLLVAAGKSEKATEFFKKLVGRFPKNGYLHHILGEVYMKLPDLRAARDHFERAIELNPGQLSSYMALADMYEKSGDWNKQVKILEDCIGKVRTFPEVYIRLAGLFMEKGLYERATEILRSGLDNNNKDPFLQNNLAWLLLEQERDVDGGLELAQMAYEHLPGDPSVADTLGWGYFKKGVLGWAEVYLNEAAAKAPDNPLIKYHLGMLFHAKGDKKSAIASLSQALALDLSPAYKERTEDILEQLKKK